VDLKSNFVFFFTKKKQNEKISHENEAKKRRPKRAPIARGAKWGANYHIRINKRRVALKKQTF
jgi:hypothetical protein